MRTDAAADYTGVDGRVGRAKGRFKTEIAVKRPQSQVFESAFLPVLIPERLQARVLENHDGWALGQVSAVMNGAA